MWNRPNLVVILLFTVIIIAATITLRPIYIIDSPHLMLWMQVLAGNWSPPKPDKISSSEFALSGVLAVTLNAGTILAIILGLWRFLTFERKLTMDLAGAVSLKDSRVKLELFSKLPAKLSLSDEQQEILAAVVEESFKTGTEKWIENSLPRVLGPKLSQAFKKKWLEPLNLD